MIALNLLHITLLILGQAFYGAYLLLDDKFPEEHDRNKVIEFTWHVIGAIVFCVMAFTFARFIGWQYAPFVFANCWLLFAGVVHVIGLGKPFFYVGTIAITDKIQRWVAKQLNANVNTVSAIVKITFYLSSIASIFLFL